MVGLNHEMARELLWREYPTDLRGSYFRQFWEVKGISNPDTPADAEQLKDITKIHTWPSASALGSHKPPPAPSADVQPGEQAARARDPRRAAEALSEHRHLRAEGASTTATATASIRDDDLTPGAVRHASSSSRCSAPRSIPDLRFFGFDLTIEKARAPPTSSDFPDDKLGWFFVIQEVPGEPRFGMDIAYDADARQRRQPVRRPARHLEQPRLELLRRRRSRPS